MVDEEWQIGSVISWCEIGKSCVIDSRLPSTASLGVRSPKTEFVAVLQPVHSICCTACVRNWHSLTVRTGPTLTSGYRVTLTVPKPWSDGASRVQPCAFLWIAKVKLQANETPLLMVGEGCTISRKLPLKRDMPKSSW